MEPDNSPRKIQFTVPLLEPHLDPEAAEQTEGRAPPLEACPCESRSLPPQPWERGLPKDTTPPSFATPASSTQSSPPEFLRSAGELKGTRSSVGGIRRRRPTPATLVLTSDQSSPEIDEDRIPNPLLKSTLAMSPRQRKKVTRTTPTMKELQMMVEHHLGQQQQGEEPEGAAESTGTQETCPSGITDTEAKSRLGTSEKAQKPAESTPKTQKRDSEKPSTEEPSTHIPPLDSQGANSV